MAACVLKNLKISTSSHIAEVGKTALVKLRRYKVRLIGDYTVEGDDCLG